MSLACLVKLILFTLVPFWLLSREKVCGPSVYI